MKISFSWLKQYIELPEPVDHIAGILTATGLEVEGIEKLEPVKGGLKGLVLGKVITCEKHPNADKLKLTTVDIGQEESVPIVCGAPNVAADQTVLVAPVGSTIYPITGDPIKIKKVKIRGEVSQGMICAEDEVGLGKDHNGIMVLSDDVKPGSEASSYFKLETDYTIEIGLTPNRADAMSHIGVARDLKAVMDRPVKWPSVDQFGIDEHSYPIKVTIENKEACPRYSGVVISDLRIGESPDWLKTSLRAIGLSPINNVVDITNYVLHETGQPLHAFDYEKIKNHEVIVKTMPDKTPFTTLDGEERKLNSNDLMICDQKNGMCIAGVLGGLESGVMDATKAIFLESAYFSPEFVRRTSQYHQIKTDAAFRFERGTDPNMTTYALKRAALLIRELAGGRVTSDLIDYYPNPIQSIRVKVKYDHIHRLIGKSLRQSRIKNILELLDIEVTNDDKNGFEAVVPPYRVDVQREADVIEEILRIYGFDNIELPSTVGASYLADFPETNRNDIQNKVTSFLVNQGFYEIMTNSLTKPSYAELTDNISLDMNVNIINYLSEDLRVLRQSLLFGGLESIAYNINRKQKDLKFFEFGKSYHHENKKYKEVSRLGIWMTGLAEPESWMNQPELLTFQHLSGIVEGILSKMNLETNSLDPLNHKLFAYGQSYSYKGEGLAEIGQCHHDILSHFGIKQEVFYADIHWDLLLKLTSDNIVVERASRYPQVRRDLSLVIDRDVDFTDILSIVKKTEKKLIKDLDVFDVYEGEKIEKNKKAYAIKFILEDKEKTLSDKLIDKTMNKLIAAFKKELKAHIRQ